MKNYNEIQVDKNSIFYIRISQWIKYFTTSYLII